MKNGELGFLLFWVRVIWGREWRVWFVYIILTGGIMGSGQKNKVWALGYYWWTWIWTLGNGFGPGYNIYGKLMRITRTNFLNFQTPRAKYVISSKNISGTNLAKSE